MKLLVKHNNFNEFFFWFLFNLNCDRQSAARISGLGYLNIDNCFNLSNLAKLRNIRAYLSSDIRSWW